jgi:lysophospholipid acyltransferase (LPLAT)-like uncharacterized protein
MAKIIPHIMPKIIPKLRPDSLSFKLALKLLGPFIKLYMGLVYATCRVQVVGQPHYGPAVYAIWHGRLVYMPKLAPDNAPTTILSSLSKDGRLGASVGRAFGFLVANGSSSKNGAAGALELIKHLGRGCNIFLTPDGPRGPYHVAKPGATTLASLANLPVIPCAANASRAKNFASWDAMQMPLPFSRICLIYGGPMLGPTPAELTAELNQLHLQAIQATAAPKGQTKQHS